MELAQDVRYMVFDGPLSENEFLSNLAITCSFREQLEDLDLRGLSSSCCGEWDAPAVERPFRPNSMRSLLAILGWMEGSPAYTWRIVAISSSAGTSLRRYPMAPALMASNT